MLQGLKTLTIGYHSLLFHTLYVTLSWKKIYKKYPSLREFICILLHDIGRINQDKSKEDTHPELGAKICGYLFGKQYYDLCICHSRDYVNKIGMNLSKLGYADKYCAILMPIKLQYILSEFPKRSDVYIVREKYLDWWNKYGYSL
jgi:hypothetical protein